MSRPAPIRWRRPSALSELLVNVRVEYFHMPLRLREFREPKLPVHAVRILRRQGPAPQTLKIGVRHHAGHEPFPQSPAAIGIKDVYIGNIRIRRKIGDH